MGGLPVFCPTQDNVKAMVFIPADRKIAIVPDLDHLPDTIVLPRDRQPAFRVLVASGLWFIMAPFLVVFSPWDFTGWQLFAVMAILFVITLAALLAGIAALRRHASNDEITLHDDHVTIRRYGWVRRQNLVIPRTQFTGVGHARHKVVSNDGPVIYHSLTLNHDDPQKLAMMFIHIDRARAEQLERRLARYLGMGELTEKRSVGGDSAGLFNQDLSKT